MPHKTWTREAIIFAIQRWANDMGEPPRATYWNRATDGFPSRATVVAEFSGWNNALIAAGFAPRPRGNPGHIDPTYAVERMNA